MGRDVSYTCPVCGYAMPRAPDDYAICPCCFTEFGVDDLEYTHAELRERWIRGGCQWHSRVVPRPADWNPRYGERW